MRVIIKPDYEQVTDWAATYIAYRINRARPTPAKPFVLGLPMGDTPKGMYKKLVELNRAGKLSFANVVIFCMNEFIGLEKNAPQSCQSYMDEYLLKHVDTKAANIYILDGRTKNYEKECSNFELAIRQKGGIDLFVGGVGADGHIAFNEPFSSLDSHTRVKTLTTETMKIKAKLFGGDISKVPHTVLTVGTGTIMDAREVMLLATGAAKAEATRAAIEGSVNHRWAVSALQMHRHGIYVCDEDAASKLEQETVSYLKDIERNARLILPPPAGLNRSSCCALKLCSCCGRKQTSRIVSFQGNFCLRKRRCSASVFRACVNWPNHGSRREKPENIWRFPVRVCFIMKNLCFTPS